MYPGAVCEVGITTRRRERPRCKRTRKLADELASSVTFFSVVAPVELSRCTSTNLPANERAAVTLVEKLPVERLTSVSVISGRTLTVTVELVALFHLASYDVSIVGLTTSVHWPPAVVVTLPSALKLVAPDGSASTSTVSPALLLETLPESETLPP